MAALFQGALPKGPSQKPSPRSSPGSPAPRISAHSLQSQGPRRWHHSYGRKQKGIKEPLDEGERGEWKSWLKTQHSKNKDHAIRSHHFMQIDGETMETVIEKTLFSWNPNHCEWWLQPWNSKTLLLGRKAMTKVDSILKSRDITLLTNVCIVNVMIFPVVMYDVRSGQSIGWEVKNWCLWNCGAEELLRVLWAARRSNH